MKAADIQDLTFKDLEELLADLPMTWYPTLIAVMVKTAITRKVFKLNHAHIYVKQVEDRFHNPNGVMLTVDPLQKD